MALPAGIDTVTITSEGGIWNPDGTPAVGQIVFTPKVHVLHSDIGAVVLPATATASLVDGHFPADFRLPAMDDPGGNPSVWTWHANERIAGGRSFDFYLARSPSTRDYADLSPVPMSSGVPVIVGPRGPQGWGLVFTDNGDGTFTLTTSDPTVLADNGDGTYTLTLAV